MALMSTTAAMAALLPPGWTSIQGKQNNRAGREAVMPDHTALSLLISKSLKGHKTLSSSGASRVSCRRCVSSHSRKTQRWRFGADVQSGAD